MDDKVSFKIAATLCVCGCAIIAVVAADLMDLKFLNICNHLCDRLKWIFTAVGKFLLFVLLHFTIDEFRLHFCDFLLSVKLNQSSLHQMKQKKNSPGELDATRMAAK